MWKTGPHKILADSERDAFASQLAVLRSCPEVISRLLKKGTPVLLAAKVLVISRLLHKKLTQHPNACPYLETLRTRLATLRRRLLASIDKRFEKLDISSEGLLEGMCSFSLATSSSPTDVLRHFLHVRLEAMSRQSRRQGSNRENILCTLRLYVRTLQDTKAIIPEELAAALGKLKSTPIFRSQDLYSLPELNLDVHERWIVGDIKLFTPYVQHDGLQTSEAQALLGQWAKLAFSTLRNGLQSLLEELSDPLTIVGLRKQMLDFWLSKHRHLPGVEAFVVLDGLRDTFNDRFVSLIQDLSKILNHIGSTIEITLRDWQNNVSDLMPSLWDLELTSMGTVKGGKAFREALVTRNYGKNNNIQIISRQYTSWLGRIEVFEDVIKKLKETRWEDGIDDIEDDDDGLDNKQILLSEDDPRVLQEQISRSLDTAFSVLEDSINQYALDLDGADGGQKAVYLLRVLREFRQHMPKSCRNVKVGLGSVHKLHQVVSDAAIEGPWVSCKQAVTKSIQRKKLPGRPLWEGDPELPVLPSPWAFKLLQDVVSSMGGFGSDVWSPHATVVLKSRLRVSLATTIRIGLQANVTEKMNGYSQDESKECTQDLKGPNGHVVNGDDEILTPASHVDDDKIQRYFDLLYLANATAMKENDLAGDEMTEAQRAAQEESGLAQEATKRMERDAEEYWKRTCLLFALLA